MNSKKHKSSKISDARQMLKNFLTVRKVVFGTKLMQKTLLLMLIMALVAIIWPNKEAEEEAAPPIIEYGVASYYANFFEGRPTSSGEIFYQHLPTAAHKTLPLGTKVKVTALETSKSTIVTINDRGPFVEGRIIDLSKSAFQSIHDIKQGVIMVRMEVLPN